VTDRPGAPFLGGLRHDLLAIVHAAIAGAHAGTLVTRAAEAHRPALARYRRFTVVAAGKAAAPMATAFTALWEDRVRNGLVIGPAEARDVPAQLVQCPGRHPVPDRRSETAARRALDLARAVVHDDECLVVLLSGGASSLMALPAAGLTIDEKAEATAALLARGVPIGELNAVRKHLSQIKGGRLAAAARNTVTLALSDVVGPPADDPSVIGSGPTVADPTTFADALAVVERAGVLERWPPAARQVLERGVRGEIEETIKPGDPRLARAVWWLAGSRHAALEAAREAAEARGYAVLTIDDPLVGEAREAGRHLMEVAARWLPEVRRPFCLLAAGETTVHVHGAGRGGRNQEVALAAALAGLPGETFVFASVGTDGIDGPTDAAGAVVDSTTLARAAAHGVGDPRRFLEANDTYRFFEALGDLVKTGPTATNVGDLQVLLVA
jgi:glycerate 2-kinase